jgi:SAM-dependent methyltransferase
MDQHLLGAFRLVEERHWWFRARQKILLDLLSVSLDSGARILDVGCGTGYFLEAASAQYLVSGIDASEMAVAFCRDRGFTDVRQGTVTDLELLPEASVDAVCLFDVLEHLADDVGALRLVQRLVPPGGLVFATVPAYQWLWSEHDVLNAHFRRYTARHLRRVFDQAGLTVERLSYFNARLFPIALGVRLVQQLLHRSHGDLVDLPPAWVNEVFRKLFAGEAKRLTRARANTYPFGLSLMVVGRSPGTKSGAMAAA